MAKDPIVALLVHSAPSGIHSMGIIPDELKNSSSTMWPFSLICHSFFFLGGDGNF
jgi:hypothetical protein